MLPRRWVHISRLSPEKFELHVSRLLQSYVQSCSRESVTTSPEWVGKTTSRLGSVSYARVKELLSCCHPGPTTRSRLHERRFYSVTRRSTAGTKDVSRSKRTVDGQSLRARTRFQEVQRDPSPIELSPNERSSLTESEAVAKVPIRKVSKFSSFPRHVGSSFNLARRTAIPGPKSTTSNQDVSNDSDLEIDIAPENGSAPSTASKPHSRQASPSAEKTYGAPNDRSTKAIASSRTSSNRISGVPTQAQNKSASETRATQVELSGNDNSNSGKSLLEALFPEERVKNQSDTSSSNPKRVIPRLPFESIHFPHIRHVTPAQDKEPKTLQEKSYDLESREDVVLRFHGTSKYLAESDFRRIIPGGQHIEGWQQDVGNIQRIIPGRNPSTLEREESYCLVFSSPASAMAYQQEAIRLHRMCFKHTPKSVTSMIPLPPGFKIDGEDAYAKLQSYALYPPSLDTDIRFEYQPFDKRTVHEVVRQDANPLMTRPEKNKHEVLLRIDGPQPTIFDVRNAIYKDGVNRGLPWATTTGPDNGVTQLKLAISLHGESHWRALNGQASEDQDEDGKSNDHCRIIHKWVVAFQTDAEAKRFVRAWHKMPLPTWWRSTEYEEVASIVHAEMLWGDI